MAGSGARPLVGRDDSLGRLVALADRVAHDAPAVAVLSGETGVGKTALLRAFLARAPVFPFAGSCVPVAGAALPYAPLSQALRSLRSSPYADRVRIGPELARLTPGAEEVPPDPAGPSSPLPLFEAVLALLQQLSRIRPVVHVVEDLHWADRSTLDLLRFLAGNLTGERVLLLASYRSDEPDDHGPLLPWLAELGRLPHTERIHLDRLSPAATRALVERLLGEPPAEDVVRPTLERSAGNPLFVEHLVAALRTGETELPGTLRELLHARVARHGGDTRRMLRAASAVGRVVPLTVLARMAERPLEEVEEALRPALEQHVLEILPGDAVGFRHPALREVVYAELLPGERARWHRAAAGALDGLGPGDVTAGEVARHWHLAGDLRQALVASVRAGYAAERIAAFDDARLSYARAVELLDRLPAAELEEPEVAALSRPTLLERAAQAASLIGEHEEAVRLTTAALAHVAPEGRAALLERLGAFEFIAGRGDRATVAFREALALLPAGEVSPLAARVRAGLALVAAAWSRFDEARAEGGQALAAARATGAPREAAIALDALGIAAAGCGDPVGGAALLRESLRLALDHGTRDDVAVTYVNLTHVLGQANLLDEAVDVGRAGLEAVRRSGLARQYGGLLMSNVGQQLLASGRLDEAEEVVRQALADLPRGVQAAPALLQSGRLAMIRGELELAWERCEQARLVLETEGAPDAWQREVQETLVEIELWSGRASAAYDLAVDALTAVCTGDERRFGGTLVMLGLRALADQAELVRPHTHAQHRLRREHDDLLRIAAGLDPDPLDPAAPAGPAPDAVPVALTCRAEADRLAARTAPHAWARAADAWEATGRPFQAAYARWREAEARLRSGVDATGIAVLRAAADTAAVVGARRLAGELATLARLYRVDLLPAPRSAVESTGEEGGSASAALAELRLTSREREVLASLAAGRTNQEIADELFISVKTASVHVSNILRKLGVPGRQEAGRLAHRLGLGRPVG